jgi:hypothetical protein
VWLEPHSHQNKPPDYKLSTIDSRKNNNSYKNKRKPIYKSYMVLERVFDVQFMSREFGAKLPEIKFWLQQLLRP